MTKAEEIAPIDPAPLNIRPENFTIYLKKKLKNYLTYQEEANKSQFLIEGQKRS